MPLAGFVLLVADHEDHKTSSKNLDKKVRVSWAWRVACESPMTRNGSLQKLRLDVEAGTINNSTNGPYAELFSKSTAAASQLLPLMAKSWHRSAPTTGIQNISKKLCGYARMKNTLVRASRDEDGNMETVEDWCSVSIENLTGAKRAVWAMLVASIFATDLSQKEGVPVVVLGRPPGHHATCCHLTDLTAPWVQSPGGKLMGHGMDGGCMYPSVWVAAVHSLRAGYASRPAYIDVDAHKPDGIWKEMERLRGLGKKQRTEMLGDADRCEKVLFASVHIDSYPNPAMVPETNPWNSVNQVFPKGPGKAFEVSLLEELLPKGTNEDGTTTNAEVLACYGRWQKCLLGKLHRFKPDGIFVGLGFDLHAAEKQISADKRVGIGIEAKNYRDVIAGLRTSSNGPIVLTLEGGYTKEAVMDGMRGTLEGLAQLSRARGKERVLKATGSSLGKRTKSSFAERAKKRRLSGSA